MIPIEISWPSVFTPSRPTIACEISRKEGHLAISSASSLPVTFCAPGAPAGGAPGVIPPAGIPAATALRPTQVAKILTGSATQCEARCLALLPPLLLSARSIVPVVLLSRGGACKKQARLGFHPYSLSAHATSRAVSVVDSYLLLPRSIFGCKRMRGYYDIVSRLATFARVIASRNADMSA